MADIDGDGNQDLITGCFEGIAYVLRGTEQGFEKATPLTFAGGAPLKVGQYWDYEDKKWQKLEEDLGIAATPVDWDGDGDLDLVLGTSEGQMLLSMNEGTATEAAFTESLVKVQAGGKDLLIPSKHAFPVIGDWDGDGLWDLISGSYDGAVYWFRNTGQKGAPRFAEAAMLVPASDGKPDSPGKRVQVAVVDFDDDGDADLLLGDYRSQADPNARNKRAWHGWVWLFRRESSADSAARGDNR